VREALEPGLSRAARHGLLGALLALGAPLGLLLVGAFERGDLTFEGARQDVASRPWTYGYVAVSTLVAFGLFGYRVGRQADRLFDLSHRDSLTGLSNRRAFEERFHDELARAARYQTPLSILLLDVDGLKQRNDRHGHRAGDLTLVGVAEAIRRGGRRTDVAARWGGDEFAILAPSTGGEEALQLAERVRELAASETDGTTVSVGVQTLEPGREEIAPEALLRAADAALYEAKERGRNRVVAAASARGAYTPAP